MQHYTKKEYNFLVVEYNYIYSYNKRRFLLVGINEFLAINKEEVKSIILLDNINLHIIVHLIPVD